MGSRRITSRSDCAHVHMHVFGSEVGNDVIACDDSFVTCGRCVTPLTEHSHGRNLTNPAQHQSCFTNHSYTAMNSKVTASTVCLCLITFSIADTKSFHIWVPRLHHGILLRIPTRKRPKYPWLPSGFARSGMFLPLPYHPQKDVPVFSGCDSSVAWVW